MNLKELLEKQGLSEEQINNIIQVMKDNKIYTTSLENVDERYQKLKSQKEDIEGELDTVNATIKDLKKNNADNEELQKTIKDHESTIETLKKDSAKREFDMALDLELVKSKCRNVKAIKALLDTDSIKRKEDGSFDGLNEQIEGYKKTDAYLFETGKVEVNYTPTKGNEPNSGDIATLLKAKDFNLTEHLKNQQFD